MSTYISRDDGDKEPRLTHRRLNGVDKQRQREGISAIHSGFVGSSWGCKKNGYRVAGKDGELASSLPVQGFYPPYGDYKGYRH